MTTKSIQWVDPDGAVFEARAHAVLTVGELIALLERTKPENRSLPLRFLLRFDSMKATSYPLSVVTRPQIPEDSTDGDKLVFLNSAFTDCGIGLLFAETLVDAAIGSGTE